jgi:hypothetical protein
MHNSELNNTEFFDTLNHNEKSLLFVLSTMVVTRVRYETIESKAKHLMVQLNLSEYGYQYHRQVSVKVLVKEAVSSLRDKGLLETVIMHGEDRYCLTDRAKAINNIAKQKDSENIHSIKHKAILT